MKRLCSSLGNRSLLGEGFSWLGTRQTESGSKVGKLLGILLGVSLGRLLGISQGTHGRRADY
jgi:hypothetical protein